jgi:hypothetical protein
VQRKPIVLLFALVACAGGPDPASGDGPDAAVPSCSSIAVVDADLEPWRAATVQWLWDQGHAGTTSEPGGETIHLRGFRIPVGAADPAPDAMAWLAGLPDFPVPAAELEVAEHKQVLDDAATLVIARAAVGATPARLWRPLASLQLSKRADGTWEVRALAMWASTALLAEAEARALADCSPSVPPPVAPILATTFEGLTMHACAIVGDYAYQPGPADAIAHAEDLDWIVSGDTWRVRRAATLTIAEEHYWPDIGGADCYCHDVAGFELSLDASSGEVLDYRPGLNCVVC